MALARNYLPEGDSQRGWLPALAVGLLVAAVTALALLVVWPPRTVRSVARATIDYRGGSAATRLDLDQVRGAIVTAESALLAWPQLEPAAREALASQVTVYRLGDSAAGNARIAVQLADPDPDQAVAAVASLTQRFLDAQAFDATLERDPAELAAARRAWAEALAAEDLARRGADALLKGHLDRLRRIEQTPAPVVAEGAEPAITPPPRVENPAYRKAQRQLEALQEKREGLLASLTPAHPLVQDVDGELEELQSRLVGLPRYLATPDADEPHGSSPRTPDHAPLLAAAQGLVGERGRIREALDLYDQARAVRLEKQAAVEVLERSTVAGPAAAPAFVWAEPARVVERQPAVAPWFRWATVLAASLLAGLAVLARLRPRSTPRTLATVEDLAHWLQVPVVAQLRLGAPQR